MCNIFQETNKIIWRIIEASKGQIRKKSTLLILISDYMSFNKITFFLFSPIFEAREILQMILQMENLRHYNFLLRWSNLYYLYFAPYYKAYATLQGRRKVWKSVGGGGTVCWNGFYADIS